MVPASWSSCIAVAGDERGFLYGVARTETDPGTCVIWVSDVASNTSKPNSAQDASISLEGIPVVQVVHTTPAIQFDVTAAVASADGHQLLVVGSSREDDQTPVLALVDIYSSQPTPASSGSSHLAAAKHKLATLIYVHQSLHSQRQGMAILQASWHPSSSSHFATLCTDNRWRLYHTAHLAEAEQTFVLHPPGSQLSLGLRRGFGSAAASGTSSRGGVPTRFTAFAFGPPGTGCWASLAVVFLASDGGVYLLCPVAPFGMRMTSTVLQRLLDQSEGTAHSWLLAAFLAVLAHESDAVSARPHMLETSAPALQGPLNHGQESLRLKVTRSIACTLSVSNTSSSNGGGLAGLSLSSSTAASDSNPGFSVLSTGFSNGVVYAHALEVGQIVPSWLDSTPQCVYDKKGEVLAVRYEVDTVPARPPDSGLTAVPENDNQSVASAAASGSGVISPLLLIDRLKINLHITSGTAAADLEDDWEEVTGDVTDSDEESDAGYDPSAASQGVRGASSASGGSRLGYGTQGDSDDDDLEDQQLLQLKRVTLHAAPELPGRFWACHDQGCWGINIRWLQQISGQLEAATESGYFQQQQDLPAPQIQELLVSSSHVASSCVVGNALFGSGCIVLEDSGALSFLRPRPAGVLGDGVVGAEGLAQLEGGEGLDLSEIQLTAEELDIKDRMEDFYADICRGPRRLPAPSKPQDLSQLSISDPAGLKYLNDMMSWLLQTHVQFATGAHADLVERIKQLHDEVQEQSSAASHLQKLAAAVAERQNELTSRIDRLKQVASTLSERSSLLAGLHWTLPRPMTNAEQQLDKQLEVWEQRRDELKMSWRALRERIDNYTTAAAAAQSQQQQQQSPQTPGGGFTPFRGLGTHGSHAKPSSPFLGVPQLAAGRAAARAQVTKPSAGPVASGQLERLKELLEEQNNTINDAREKLADLFDELDAWRVEHPEVELPGRLRGQVVI